MGTHDDAPAPNQPEVGRLATWFTIGVLPQTTTWIAFTAVAGGIFGGMAAAVTRSSVAREEAAYALAGLPGRGSDTAQQIPVRIRARLMGEEGRELVVVAAPAGGCIKPRFQHASGSSSS